MQFFENRQNDSDPQLRLTGDWTVANSAAIEKDVRHIRAQKNAQKNNDAALDFSGIGKLDTAGAWLIRKYFPDAQLTGMDARQKALMEFVPDEKKTAAPEKKKRHCVIQFFVDVGHATVWSAQFIYGIICFMGAVFIRIFKNLGKPGHFRPNSIIRHIHETGVLALPIICMLAFGISMVISYQGANQLQKFGADIYTVDLTVVSLLREMAVLVTAIMVAGRSGSAFAAEIGVMKMRGEVDALQTLGMDPIEVLVVPRLIALLLALPALAFIADIVGLAGGAVMGVVKLQLSLGQYIDRIQAVATGRMFFIGMIKAPVFALLITAVCTYQGMSAEGSAEAVGKLTTLAVVQSIFLVIMSDAVFSIIFAKVGI